jgi:spore maturation protein CgeB
MKILRISHIFASSSLEDKYIKLALKNKEKSYLEEIEEILDLGLDSSASILEGLKVNFSEVINIYYDLEWIQKKWADENSVKYTEKYWQKEILVSQIKKIKPEYILIQKSALGVHDIFRKIKRECQSIKKIIVHSAYLGRTGEFDFADLVLAGTNALVEKFEKKGYKTKLFYHYFDHKILDIIGSSKGAKTIPLTFLGMTGYGQGYIHARRYWLLRSLLQKTDIEVWGFDLDPELKSTSTFKELVRLNLKHLIKLFPWGMIPFKTKIMSMENKVLRLFAETLVEKNFEREGVRIPNEALVKIYPDRVHKPVHGNNYYEILGKSQITFHKHGDSVVDFGNNRIAEFGALRVFEATGLGACLVLDDSPFIKDVFCPHSEVVTYKSEAEAVDKISWLLKNPEVVKEFSRRGQMKTLNLHTGLNRGVQLYEILKASFRS